MTWEVHGVMQQSQNLDKRTILICADSKHYKMTPFTAAASDMQREQSFGNVITGFCPGNSRASGQSLQRRRQGLGIDARLCLAELHGGPAQDVLEIGLGGGGETGPPGGLPCGHLASFPDRAPAIALSANVAR